MRAEKITTDRQVAGLKAAERPFEVAVEGARGLILRVFPTGTKAFEVRYTAENGARRRHPLGPYPGLTLSKAREKANALRVDIVAGVDPAGVRAAARHAARAGETLSDLAEGYFAAAAKGLHGGRGRPKRASTLAVERNRWTRHIAPRLGDTRFRQLKRADVKAFMRQHATAGELSADTIASVGSTLSSILAFAVHEEHLEANPATGVTKPLRLAARERLFDDAAMAKLWRALSPAMTDHNPPVASIEAAVPLALRFAILTLARRGEVAGARWSEIDRTRATWTIPPERAKSSRTHVVPLSAASVEIVDAAARLGGGEFLFASPKDRSRHVDEHALTRAIARLCDRLEIPRGSPHDFRRSGATTLTGEKLGVRRFVVSKVLGHAASEGAAVTGVYDRNDYLAEKRAALDAWARHIIENARPQSEGAECALVEGA